MTLPIEMYLFECLLHSFARRNACLLQIACKWVPPYWLTWGGMKPLQTIAAIWTENPLERKPQEVCASGDAVCKSSLTCRSAADHVYAVAYWPH